MTDSELEASQLNSWNIRCRELYLKKFPPRIQAGIIVANKLDIKNVESTYIHGRVGSGKTTLAAFMALCERKQTFLNHQNGINGEFIFIAVPELLLEFRATYNEKTSEVTECNVLDKYTKIHLLVLDDLGVEKTTDWSFQMLYILINRRYEDMSKTIITSNLNLKELSEKLGDDRITGRIQQMCQIIKMENKNFRIR